MQQPLNHNNTRHKTNNVYDIVNVQNTECLISPEDINTSSLETYRYQSKYCQFSFKSSVMHEEVIMFFIPKGLVSAAFYQCDKELRAFLVFDKPKDFILCKDTNYVMKPKYFEDIFEGAIIRGSDNFDVDISIFQKLVLKENYKCLLGDEKNFLFNLEIKDINYFNIMFSKSYLTKSDDLAFNKYRDQIVEYGAKLKSDILCFNDLIMRIKIKYNDNDLDIISETPSVFSNDSNLKKNIIPKKVMVKPQVSKRVKNTLPSKSPVYISTDIVSLNTLDDCINKISSFNISALEFDKIKQKLPLNLDDLEPKLKEEIKLLIESFFINNMSNNDNRVWLLERLDDGIVTYSYLYAFLELPEGQCKQLLLDYTEANFIDLSKSKNDLLRILAMYYGIKPMPKTSDPNKWLKNLKDRLPDKIYNHFKKYF